MSNSPSSFSEPSGQAGLPLQESQDGTTGSISAGGAATGATAQAVSGDELVIQVGASPLVTHTPTGASFDPVTGLMTLIIGNHNISVGDSVKLADGAVTFTCAQDNNATNQTYPRTTNDTHKISDHI